MNYIYYTQLESYEGLLSLLDVRTIKVKESLVGMDEVGLAMNEDKTKYLELDRRIQGS